MKYLVLLLLCSCLLNPHELGFRSDNFTPDDLPDMIAWLDGSKLSSIRDSSGVNANNPAFDGTVRFFDDTSGSTNVHNFYQNTASNRPSFDPSTGLFTYDGVDDFLTVTNHADLNLDTVNQRNLTVAFKTGSDIATRQVIYDEGGSVRGMNIYIYNGDLYCGFYNTTEDGDGSQPFVSVTSAISTEEVYYVSWVFDYTNYVDPGGIDGSLECYVNGISIGTESTTSRLFGHPGAIGVGGVTGSTVMDNGVLASGAYFSGSIMEVMIFNDPPTATDIIDVHRYLSFKWAD
jgi:hypothetical protein